MSAVLFIVLCVLAVCVVYIVNGIIDVALDVKEFFNEQG